MEHMCSWELRGNCEASVLESQLKTSSVAVLVSPSAPHASRHNTTEVQKCRTDALSVSDHTPTCIS